MTNDNPPPVEILPVSEPPRVFTSVSRFTPCPDVLVERYGHTTALVWGKIWRYSQMSDGVCRAAVLRLAEEMGLAPNTIAKHIRILERDGYVKDSTPWLRNRPHLYVPTAKLALRVQIDMGDGSTTQNLSSTTQNLSSHYSKIAYEETTTNSPVGNSKIYKLYQENIAFLTPVMAEILGDAINEYPAEWIEEAIGLAVENNKRNWRYCETILKRWKASGKDAGKGKPAGTREDELRKAGYDV